MKFNLDEHETHKELYSVRDIHKNFYVKMEKYVMDKKEKLWRSKDPYKWGGFKDNLEVQKLKDQLLKPENKEPAF